MSLQLLQDYWEFIVLLASGLAGLFGWWYLKKPSIIANSQNMSLDRMQGYIDVIKNLNATIIAQDTEKASKDMTINELKVRISKLELFKEDALKNCQNIEACIMQIKKRHD